LERRLWSGVSDTDAADQLTPIVSDRHLAGLEGATRQRISHRAVDLFVARGTEILSADVKAATARSRGRVERAVIGAGRLVYLTENHSEKDAWPPFTRLG
jgi:hypothetical protein